MEISAKKISREQTALFFRKSTPTGIAENHYSSDQKSIRHEIRALFCSSSGTSIFARKVNIPFYSMQRRHFLNLREMVSPAI